jgi:hypothetical protein
MDCGLNSEKPRVSLERKKSQAEGVSLDLGCWISIWWIKKDWAAI